MDNALRRIAGHPALPYFLGLIAIASIACLIILNNYQDQNMPRSNIHIDDTLFRSQIESFAQVLHHQEATEEHISANWAGLTKKQRNEFRQLAIKLISEPIDGT